MKVHPLSAAAGLAASVLLFAAAVFTAPQAIGPQLAPPAAAPAIAPTVTPVLPSVPKSIEPTPAECPAYAQAVENSQQHRVLVVCMMRSCPACVVMRNALQQNGVPYAEVSLENHPETTRALGATAFPQWMILEKGRVISKGVGNFGALELKGKF